MPKPIRPIRIEGQLAHITLTKGYEAVIDVADVPLVSGWNWTAQTNGSENIYAVRGERRDGRVAVVMMHRVIARAPQGIYVDHIDMDALNNRRANLRLVTRSENSMNRGPQKNNKSGFKGVSWSKSSSLWRAQIKLLGRVRDLGCFNTPEDAHAAYCKANAELHGKFGRTS